MGPQFLLDLPAELLIRILYHLSLWDLLTVRLWSRQFDKTIRDSPLLQYRIQTHIAGVEDNPYCTLTIKERAEALRRREEAWSSLVPIFETNVPFPPGRMTRYNFTGGMYAASFSLGHGLRSNMFWYAKLPTAETEPLHTGTFNTKYDIADFGLSPISDLVAVVSMHYNSDPERLLYESDDRDEYHLRAQLLQISTGEQHPAARHPIFVIGGSFKRQPPITVEVVGKYLVVMAEPADSEDEGFVNIYSWKTGELALSVARTGTQFSDRSFAFLDEETVVLPNTPNQTLEIWRIPPNPDDATRSSPIQILGLPALNEFEPRKPVIKCRARPDPLFTLSPGNQRPFTDAMINGLVLVEMRFIRGHAYWFVVHRSTLLSLLKTGSPDLGSTEFSPIAWSNWGPGVTSWLPQDINQRWFMVSHAQRFACISWDRHAPIVVRDYNPNNFKQLLQKFPNGSPFARPVSEESPTFANVFDDDIHSKLPYVEYYSPEDYDFDGIVIDEERIVGSVTSYLTGRLTGVVALYFG